MATSTRTFFHRVVLRTPRCVLSHIIIKLHKPSYNKTQGVRS